MKKVAKKLTGKNVEIGDVMTLKEIEKKFDQEFVLIKNPERTKTEKLKCGIVLGHSKDKHKLYKKIGQFKPEHFAVMFIGKRPEGLAYLL